MTENKLLVSLEKYIEEHLDKVFHFNDLTIYYITAVYQILLLQWEYNEDQDKIPHGSYLPYRETRLK